MKYCPECQRTYPNTQRFCAVDRTLLSLKDPYQLVGRTLAEKYRVDALVGAGGMGAVYSAQQIGINRRVAFKILLPHLALNNKDAIDLFEREAQLAGSLSHENIATIFDSGRTTDDIAYIAMEWLEGHTLDEELSHRGLLGFDHAAGIFRQLCAALEVAHASHIIHRDLKPSNVMLVKRPDGGDQVKVLDFGIAKVISNTAGVPVSQAMGTPHYASPEQFQLGMPIDGRSDIYSLGVILFKLLTGRLPFNAPSLQELIQMHLLAPPPALRSVRPDASAAIERLVSNMLAKHPSHRPQRVRDIRALLDKGLASWDEPQPTTGAADTLVGPAQTTIPARTRIPASVQRAQAKVCMLGGYAVGKTSLVSRFVHSVFSEKYLTTIGVKVDQKAVHVGERQVKLMLWDIYGQDDFQQIQMTYLHGALGYLLVVDRSRRATLDTALSIRTQVEQTFGRLPFVLVLNKTDLTDRNQIPDSVVQKLSAQGITVIKASAKTGLGVEEAFHTLANDLLKS